MVVLAKDEKNTAVFFFLLDDLVESSPKAIGCRFVRFRTYNIDVEQIPAVELLYDRGPPLCPLWKIGDIDVNLFHITPAFSDFSSWAFY